ncbi:NADH:ubiquinone oxidoreductase ND3 subunit [Volvox carteri f. nagariensis]|uniref:NADH-ubiquinone oxidoreductase chain 3 n=1 Tax=Volvox carteri f. nagariensis TaxID=3068 RepID=D8U2Q5_VOLCA|nr:NADH:ubiquinone oxidoreductase ND3 subunit [Volvox carteri f. nagariensis]EFJ45848.1 NADH:ubiquinone oxidoreductase ND3 subunit [Volvox carteri f. nagariensis]|eukprot:XP_002952926.1 NADH:ubiquinone oxidoreductase ND3 subunit [Volvox carteri f. nagariensis]
MALRSASGVTLGASRLLPCLSAQLSRELQTCLVTAGRDDQSTEVQQQGPLQQQQYVREKVNNAPLGLGFAAQALFKAPQQPCLAQPGISAAPFLPTRAVRTSRLPGMARMAGLPRFPLAQHRAYNAWSPAQRYFVEGDHVIAAEANRTFQFTGLDSGSFYPYVIATAISTVIATVFIVVPLVVAPSRVDLDKSSAYECGFDAFGEARQTFSVSFYLVSIMYLLFDIEIAYLFPYAMSHASLPMYWTMNLFLAILVAGFAYEWGMGALEWRE